MKVKAIGVGQYNGRLIERGEVFEIQDHLFSRRWMEKISESLNEPVASNPAISEKRSESRDPGESEQHIAEKWGLA